MVVLLVVVLLLLVVVDGAPSSAACSGGGAGCSGWCRVEEIGGCRVLGYHYSGLGSELCALLYLGSGEMN